MTEWSVVTGDILDERADVLVCSANPFLTLSGGVGGAFLLRYGPAMQERLKAHLESLGVRHVPTGTVVCMPPCNSPYVAVLHAVAVDGFYNSSPDLIAAVTRRALLLAKQLGGNTMALPALATGYGHLTMSGFAAGIQALRDFAEGPARVLVCLPHAEDADLVRTILETV